MSLHFYPNLLSYQASSQVGKWIHNNQIPLDEFYYYNEQEHAIDFYTSNITSSLSKENIDNLKRGSLVYTSEIGKNELLNLSKNFSVYKIFPSYKVTMLTLKFLNKNTRSSVLKNNYLLKYQ